MFVMFVPLSFLSFLLQSKEIICQLQEDLMKLLNELYTVQKKKKTLLVERPCADGVNA